MSKVMTVSEDAQTQLIPLNVLDIDTSDGLSIGYGVVANIIASQQ